MPASLREPKNLGLISLDNRVARRYIISIHRAQPVFAGVDQVEYLYWLLPVFGAKAVMTLRRPLLLIYLSQIIFCRDLWEVPLDGYALSG
jgi:hypothetical protein